jgi:nucleotide-binding universal stress UspA family protein
MTISIQKILIPVDSSSCSLTALHTAKTLNANFNAQLFVHHVHEPGIMSSELQQEIKTILEPNSYTYSETKGNVTKDIITKAEEIDADLIIMGTHGVNGFQEFWMGSNAYKIVSSAKCPVLTIRANVSNFSFKKIVLPIDSSFETRQKIPAAVTIAQQNGGSIHLIGVSTSKEKDAEIQISNYLNQACHSITDKGITCSIEKRLGGNITDVTIAYASEINADLIVVMSEQEPQVGSFFLGKFARQMVNHSPIPVITVPTRDDLMLTDARL